MNDLPPLPKPFDVCKPTAYNMVDKDEAPFTADQMQAYALLAVAALATVFYALTAVFTVYLVRVERAPDVAVPEWAMVALTLLLVIDLLVTGVLTKYLRK